MKEFIPTTQYFMRHLQTQNTTTTSSSESTTTSDGQEGLARIALFSLIGVAIVIVLVTTVCVIKLCKRKAAERKQQEPIKQQAADLSKIDTTLQGLRMVDLTQKCKYSSDTSIPNKTDKLRRQSTDVSQQQIQRCERQNDHHIGKNKKLDIIYANQRKALKEDGNSGVDFNKNIVLDLDQLKIDQSFDGCGNKTYDNSTSIQDQSNAQHDHCTSTDYKSLSLAERENSFNHCGISYEARRIPLTCTNNIINMQSKTEVLYFKKSDQRQNQTIDEEMLQNNRKERDSKSFNVLAHINQNRAQSQQTKRTSFQTGQKQLNNCTTEVKIPAVPPIQIPSFQYCVASAKIKEQVFDYNTFSNLTEEQKAYNQNKMQQILLKNNNRISRTARSNQTSKTRIPKPPTQQPDSKSNKENIMPIHTQKCLQYKNGLQFIKESISLVIN